MLKKFINILSCIGFCVLLCACANVPQRSATPLRKVSINTITGTEQIRVNLSVSNYSAKLVERRVLEAVAKYRKKQGYKESDERLPDNFKVTREDANSAYVSVGFDLGSSYVSYDFDLQRTGEKWYIIGEPRVTIACFYRKK